jgi:hypothetical protein
MFIEIFEWSGDQLVLSKPEIMLHPEFEYLWNDKTFNKTKKDKNGTEHGKATRAFRYIWLAYDFKSSYMELTKEEREEVALEDSGLTLADVNSPIMLAAIAKYEQLQDTRLLKLLRTANNTVDKIRVFLDTLDLQDKDDNGKLVHNSRQIMQQVSELGKVSEGMKELEYQVKKEMDATKKVRGEIDLGLFD